MKYVEMILSIDDANILQFPTLLDRVVKWKEQGIKFIRMVTDAIRPSEVIHLSGASNKQHVSTKLTFNDIYDAIKQPTEQNFTILKSRKEEIDMNNKANSFIDNYSKISSDIDIYKNLIESKYYDFFNIMIKSPENTNYSYAIKVELL